MIDRLAKFLYLATLALLPWGTIVGFPWLHENAQWSDVLFALAAALWAAGVVASRQWPRLRLVHAGLGLYLGWAALSLLAADPRPASGPTKLLGVAMLVALMVVTSELARRSGMPRAIGLTVAITSVLVAVAAVVGVGLSVTGRLTFLVGTCGDLLPGPLWRAQAGFSHPNLLASYCIFASGVVAWPSAGLSRRLRRLAQVAITLTILLTFSRAILGFALAAAIRGATTPRTPSLGLGPGRRSRRGGAGPHRRQRHLHPGPPLGASGAARAVTPGWRPPPPHSTPSPPIPSSAPALGAPRVGRGP